MNTAEVILAVRARSDEYAGDPDGMVEYALPEVSGDEYLMQMTDEGADLATWATGQAIMGLIEQPEFRAGVRALLAYTLAVGIAVGRMGALEMLDTEIPDTPEGA